MRVRLIPSVNEVTAQVTTGFFDRWFRDLGMHEKIISDQDSKFMSDFWRALHKLLGTRLNLSSANHPEPDGRSERTNRNLEDTLRVFVSMMNIWVLLLSVWVIVFIIVLGFRSPICLT